jgi:hypothetical protein
VCLKFGGQPEHVNILLKTVDKDDDQLLKGYLTDWSLVQKCV